MRGSILAAAMACAILGAGTMIAGRADAITPAGQGLRPAIESVNPADTVACWHHPRYKQSMIGDFCAPVVGHVVRHVAPLVEITPAPPYPARQRYFSRW